MLSPTSLESSLHPPYFQTHGRTCKVSSSRNISRLASQQLVLVWAQINLQKLSNDLAVSYINTDTPLGERL